LLLLLYRHYCFDKIRVDKMRYLPTIKTVIAIATTIVLQMLLLFI
jgi:hypothetical protein